jgi:hypothetical protein
MHVIQALFHSYMTHVFGKHQQLLPLNNLQVTILAGYKKTRTAVLHVYASQSHDADGSSCKCPVSVHTHTYIITHTRRYSIYMLRSEVHVHSMLHIDTTCIYMYECTIRYLGGWMEPLRHHTHTCTTGAVQQGCDSRYQPASTAPCHHARTGTEPPPSAPPGRLNGGKTSRPARVCIPVYIITHTCRYTIYMLRS